MLKISTRSRPSNHNPPRGGQASIGLFGLPRRTPTRVQSTVLPQSTVPDAFVVRLRRNRFQAFVRLAERERRPVGEVLAEWLSNCTALIGCDEVLNESEAGMTPAMRLAAIASDDRERRVRVDDTEAEFEHRTNGAGYVDVVLAMDC